MALNTHGMKPLALRPQRRGSPARPCEPLLGNTVAHANWFRASLRCTAAAEALTGAPSSKAAQPSVHVVTPTSETGCPVLGALKQLPQSDIPLWRQALMDYQEPDGPRPARLLVFVASGSCMRMVALDTDFSNPHGFQRTLLKDLPLISGSFIGMKAVVIGDADIAREILAKEGEGITVGWPKSTVSLLGEHSLVVTGDIEKHRFMRRLMVASLKQDVVDEMVPELQDIIQTHMARWAAEGAAGRTVEAYPELKRLTFEIITRVLVGDLPASEVSYLRDLYTVWVQSLFSALPIDAWPFPFHTSMNSRRALIKYLSRTVADVRREVERAPPQQQQQQPAASAATAATSTTSTATSSSAADGNGASASAAVPGTSGRGTKGAGRGAATVLQRMLLQRDEAGRGLTDAEILDNLVTMFFAGHDTSTSAMSSALLLIAKHPHVMERLREEQRAVVAAHGEQLTGELLRSMPYAEATMREVMRYSPVVNSVARRSTAHIDLAGYHVPAGEPIIIGLTSMMQRDARFAGSTGELSPECFAPERFLTEEEQGRRQQGSQVPFGIGNRICLGMPLAQAEIVATLALLARGYEYRADWNTEMINFPIPRPKNNLPIIVSRLAAQ